MNIIKIKDVLLDSTSGLSQEKIAFFNKNLKGKYSYIINWVYVIPFDLISQEEYVKISMGEPLKEGTYLTLKEIPSNVIDLDETNYTNSIDKYKSLNKYTTDPDITIDEIKKFRPWLAYSLLNEGVIVDNDIKHMLDYYNFDDPANQNGSGMYNDVIKYLSVFGNTYVLIDNYNNIRSKSGCSCNSQTRYDVLGEREAGMFGVENVYRMNLYVKMVNTFKDVAFWEQFSNTVLVDMKNYIDNIINVNLPLYSITRTSNYCDCGDLSVKDLQQSNNIKILENLSKSLQYIMDGDIYGHKNFINDSLFKWASVLYERMYWGVVNNTNRPINNNNDTFMYVNEDGDVLVKGVDANNNRMDYKLLSGQSTLEPIDDNDIVTGDYLENYLQDHVESTHIFQDLSNVLK